MTASRPVGRNAGRCHGAIAELAAASLHVGPACRGFGHPDLLVMEASCRRETIFAAQVAQQL